MRRFLGLLLVALVLAGCSASVSTGEKAVSSDELTQQVKAAIEKRLGIDVADVSCPSEVEAKVGETTTCATTSDGQETDLKVTITSVDGTDVEFDIEGDADAAPTTEASTTTTAAEETRGTSVDGPASVAPVELERQLNARLEAQFGAAPDALTCPDPLQDTVGATTTCVLTDGPESYDVLLTTRTVDGLEVNFDFKVADTPN